MQFDGQYEVVFDKPLREVPLLTQDTFVPRGSTALLDAQGRTILDLGRELAAMEECERPSKVMVLTLTHGEENASKEFTLERVAAMIQQQSDIYKWDFLYLGANQDAVKVATSMSMMPGSAMTFAASPGGMAGTMRAASILLSRRRSGEAVDFTDNDRAVALAGDVAAVSVPGKPETSQTLTDVMNSLASKRKSTTG